MPTLENHEIETEIGDYQHRAKADDRVNKLNKFLATDIENNPLNELYKIQKENNLKKRKQKKKICLVVFVLFLLIMLGASFFLLQYYGIINIW